MSSKKTTVALIKYHLANSGGLEKQAYYIKKAFEMAGNSVDLISKETLQLKPNPFSFQNIHAFNTACEKHLTKNPYSHIFTMDRISCATHIRAGNGCHAAYLNRRIQFEPLHKFTFGLNPLHRTLLHLEKTAFENPFLRKLITNSHMVKQEILSRYNIPEEKITTIHNGVEWEKFAQSYSQFTPNSTYHFLFVGSGFKRKGLDLLLPALSKLSEKNWRLSIVGHDRNLPYYIKLTKKLHLQKQIHFYGKVGDTTPFYQKADCLILPTLYDPFANTTIEALAMGLTVVTSKTNGGHEILKPETGIIIDDLTSQDSLIASLQKALTRPKTLKLAKTIRNSVQSLSFENQLKELTDQCLNS